MYFQNKRKINRIFLHCSDAEYDHDSTEIKHWHVNENGWADIGYHFVYTKKGERQDGRPLETAGSHCRGHNADSIAICLCGRVKFTRSQIIKCVRDICDLLKIYNLPVSAVVAHNEIDRGKTCPNIPGEVIRLLVEQEVSLRAIRGDQI